MVVPSSYLVKPIHKLFCPTLVLPDVRCYARPMSRRQLVSVKLLPTLVAQLDDLAADDGATRSQHIELAVRAYVQASRRRRPMPTPLPPQVAREEGDGTPAHMPPT
jgi:hypothetical protein